MDVRRSDDAAEILSVAGPFLRARPVEHNLVLSLLAQLTVQPEPGRVWIVVDGDEACGVVVQTSPDRRPVLTPMPDAATVAAVDAIADDGVVLPGVMGDAATAARFAGHWAERRHEPVLLAAGMRLYELGRLVLPRMVPGALRLAGPDDVALLIDWMIAFASDAHRPTAGARPSVRPLHGPGQSDVELDLSAHGLRGGVRGARLQLRPVNGRQPSSPARLRGSRRDLRRHRVDLLRRPRCERVGPGASRHAGPSPA